MNNIAFILVAILTLAAALAAASLRELMHAALSFPVALVGLAAFFFLLGAEFVDHFAKTREWEWRQFQDAVTDWELKRYFEII